MTATELVSAAASAGRFEHEDLIVLAQSESYAVLRKLPSGVVHGLHGMDAERATAFVAALQRCEGTDGIVQAWLASARAELDLGPRGDL